MWGLSEFNISSVILLAKAGYSDWITMSVTPGGTAEVVEIVVIVMMIMMMKMMMMKMDDDDEEK